MKPRTGTLTTSSGVSTDRIHPVLLSGGSGTRLWPLSRSLYPKQLVALNGPRSLLQQTLERVSADFGYAAPVVICNEQHRFIVAQQLRAMDVRPASLVLEPVGRNTAPAVAVAALLLAADDPQALMLVLPSDHVVQQAGAFRDAVARAAPAARSGALVTFGVTPQRVETGFGYIRRGGALDGMSGCFEVESFVEKPDLATAERYVAEGDFYWNSGVFLFTARRYLEELERLEPGIVTACRAAVGGAARDLDFLRLESGAFAETPARSIDVAVMERTRSAAMVPVDMGWQDLGSWVALHELGAKDDDNNVVVGDVVAKDSRNCYLRSDGPLIAAVGLEDMIVVATDDAVLVVPAAQAQQVKDVVKRLAAEGRSEHEAHTEIHRPWGSYQSIDTGGRHQVKRLTVHPGAKLSLQMHHHRAEHWVVVRGTAQVTRGDKTFILHENESTYIPMGVRHRLENPGKITLDIIEIQSGSYLGEDDIVRFEDTYGRN